MAQSQELNVLKRNGECEEMSFDKIIKRIKTLGKEANIIINYSALVIKIIDQLYDRIPTSQIDELTAQQCASLVTKNKNYNILASRIVISNNHKNTHNTFFEAMEELYNNNNRLGESHSLISKKIYDIIVKNKDIFNNMIIIERDYLIDFFGFKTLERAYLIRKQNKVIERIQYMWLRVAIGIHEDNLELVEKTYNYLSQKYFIHATPTLFNAGTNKPQLSSCYLLALEDDSIDGIYNTLKDCALISKLAGGIGLHIHNLRAAGSHIYGTNGTSNGLVPMLRVFNNTARYVDQGGNKRNGSFAIYLEVWHADIIAFLDLKKNHGDEEMRARDLFYALWVCDLFMKRVKNDEMWTLMCPNECKGLSDCYGKEFDTLYQKYESDNLGRQQIKARDLWFKILDSQMETGTPYLLYKDSCNRKSNQKNLGTIKSSNLCTEILEYSDKDETAVCNLASIGLSKFVKQNKVTYNAAIMFTKSSCPFCIKAKNLLDAKNIPVDIVNLDDNDTRQLFYNQLTEQYKKEIKTVPQIFLDDKLIGGHDDLLTLFFSNPKEIYFDYDELYEVTKIITYNLNRIIDLNYYPTEKTERSNLLHRPIGIGIQGLADTFILMDIAYESAEAVELNKKIFETIYMAAIDESNNLAHKRYLQIENLFNQLYEINESQVIAQEIFDSIKDTSLKPHDTTFLKTRKHIQTNSEIKELMEELNLNIAELRQYFKFETLAGAYSSFAGSPASRGTLQFDMWDNVKLSYPILKWNKLKENIIKYGLRNSLLVAPMPTASTSQILGNNECFEPLTSNIYTRRTLAGEFIIANKYLMEELEIMGLWNDELKLNIIENKGSIQHLTHIPKHIRDKYKIVWEIPMKKLIDMARDRGAFICQSQSLNLWSEDPTYKSLTNMHFYSWQQGLKTGIYYLRRKAKHQPQQFTIEPTIEKVKEEIIDEELCEACSS